MSFSKDGAAGEVLSLSTESFAGGFRVTTKFVFSGLVKSLNNVWGNRGVGTRPSIKALSGGKIGTFLTVFLFLTKSDTGLKGDATEKVFGVGKHLNFVWGPGGELRRFNLVGLGESAAGELVFGLGTIELTRSRVGAVTQFGYGESNLG